MAKVKGAQGIEIIPNIGFWKDLPFLIKVNCVLWCALITIVMALLLAV